MARIQVAQANLTAQVEEPVAFESVGGDHTLPENALVTSTEVAENHSSVFPPLDTTTYPSQLLWLAISFGVLYLVMKRVALPKIGNVLEERRNRIEGDLAEADRLRQKTDAAIASYEAALAEAKSNATKIAETSRADNKAQLETQRKAVEADLAKKVAEAEVRIAGSKATAMNNVDDIAAETAQAVVGQLVGNVSAEAARDAVAKASKE